MSIVMVLATCAMVAVIMCAQNNGRVKAMFASKTGEVEWLG